MIINTNVSSQVTQNYLRKNNNELEAAMAKLSSGRRINQASDDAAGMSIATRMTTQVRGMDVATRNANDGISLIQTAESALGSISDILQRMRELSVQADNGTYGTEDKASMQAEVTALAAEIEHIATTTNFNGIKLLAADSTVNLHISDLATDTLTLSLKASTVASLSVDALNVSTGAQDAITKIDAALQLVSTNRSDLGAMQNRLNFTIDNLATANTNTSAARSRIEDADMAKEMSSLTRAEILNQSAIAMLSRANQNPQQILSLLK